MSLKMRLLQSPFWLRNKKSVAITSMSQNEVLDT